MIVIDVVVVEQESLMEYNVWQMDHVQLDRHVNLNDDVHYNDIRFLNDKHVMFQTNSVQRLVMDKCVQIRIVVCVVI